MAQNKESENEKRSFIANIASTILSSVECDKVTKDIMAYWQTTWIVGNVWKSVNKHLRKPQLQAVYKPGILSALTSDVALLGDCIVM